MSKDEQRHPGGPAGEPGSRLVEARRVFAEAALRTAAKRTGVLIPARYGCVPCDTEFMITSPMPPGPCPTCGRPMSLITPRGCATRGGAL